MARTTNTTPKSKSAVPSAKSSKTAKPTKAASSSSKPAAAVSKKSSTTAAAKGPRTPKTRRTVTPESISALFLDLLTYIDAEIERLRASPEKVKGVKTLRSVGKRVKVIQADVSRVTKGRRPRGKNPNPNSGFMKPVAISEEMAKFIGTEKGTPTSRVSVTKAICEYVKRENLQNPANRREIIPNAALAALLGRKEPMRYCDIQVYIKRHFPALNEA